MEPTTLLAWLIGLSAWLVLLTVATTLDIRRTLQQGADDLARRMERGITEPDRPPPGAAGASMPEPSGYRAATDPDGAGPRGGPRHAVRQLSGPPMIGNRTLRDWLIHSTHRDGVWSEVVAEFYNRAAAVPEVADYFRETDMAALQLHFTQMLCTITHSGVTDVMVTRLAMRHQHVLSSDGDPITGPVWGAVIGTLVDVLRQHRVPEGALNELGATIAPLQQALVRA